MEHYARSVKRDAHSVYNLCLGHLFLHVPPLVLPRSTTRVYTPPVSRTGKKGEKKGGNDEVLMERVGDISFRVSSLGTRALFRMCVPRSVRDPLPFSSFMHL